MAVDPTVAAAVQTDLEVAEEDFRPDLRSPQVNMFFDFSSIKIKKLNSVDIYI